MEASDRSLVSFLRPLGAGIALMGTALVAACAAEPPSTALLSDARPNAVALAVTSPTIDSAAGSYLAARVARHERDMAAAARYFTRALDADPENVDLLRQTYLSLLADGRWQRARDVAKALVARRPNEPIAALVLVTDDFAHEDYASARDRLAVLPHQGYNMLMVPLLTAWAAAGAGDIEAARNALAGLEGNEAFTIFRRFHRGLIEAMAGNDSLAEAALKKVVAVQSGGGYRPVMALGRLYERSGRSDKAAALYRAFMAENPDSLWFAPALARIAAGTKPEPLVRDPREGAAEALHSVASALFQENAVDAALLYARMALHLRPDHDSAHMLVGEIYDALKQPKRAVAAFTEVPAASPLAWSARLRVARDLDDMGRTDEAIGALEKMAAERPKRADPLTTMGDILRGHERWLESVAAYDRAFARIGRLERRQWRLLYARAIALERSNQWKRAEADFLEALKFEPDQPFVLNYLGYSWVDQGVNLDRALKMIRRAVDLRPNDGFIVDSLGWAYFRLGAFDKAVTRLERAVELKPNDPVLNDHLGDAYWRVGRHTEARFQWRRALTLKPTEAGQAEALQAKLRHGLLPGPVANDGI